MTINSLHLDNLTTDELHELNKRVVNLIRSRRKNNVDSKKRQLSLGSVVRFGIDRHGSKLSGVVTKIMRTRCHVRTPDGGIYRCHLNGLELVS